MFKLEGKILHINIGGAVWSLNTHPMTSSDAQVFVGGMEEAYQNERERDRQRWIQEGVDRESSRVAAENTKRLEQRR